MRTIVGDPHIVHRSLETASQLFSTVEAIGNDCIWTGDILDNKEIIRGKCLNLFFDYLKNSKLRHIILVGNHDYFNLECQDYSIRSLSALPNVKIVDAPHEESGMTFIPYYHDLEKLRSVLKSFDGQNKTLVGHLDVVGFDYGNGESSDKGLALDELSSFRLVISGHYHAFQQRGNLVYIGSPFSHSWGETDQVKYLGLYDEVSGQLSLMNTTLPRHVTLDLDLGNVPSDKDLDQYFTGNAGNYVRTILHGTQAQISAFSRDKYPQVKKWVPKATDRVDSGIVLEESLDNKTQFLKWATDVKKLDQDTIQIGLSILATLSSSKTELDINVKSALGSLTKVKGKNFLSWGDLEFDVPPGVTLIDGWNADDETPEGSGKSAIPNLLCWIFFGQYPKDVNIDEVIKFGEKSGGGAAYFSDGVTIVRTRKPNDLYLRTGNGTIIKGKDSRETQQLIQEYLGMTFESYCQSIYFAQNYDKKFLPSNQDDKGKILSDIQDIAIFDKARKEVQSLSKLEGDKLTSLKNQIRVEETSLAGLKSQQAMVRQFIDEKNRQHQAYLEVLVRNRDAYQTNLATVQKYEDDVRLKIQGFDLKELTDRDAQLKMAYEQIQSQVSGVVYNKSQIHVLRKSVAFKQEDGKRCARQYHVLTDKKSALEAYVLNPTKNCPTCNTPITNSDTSHAQQELQSIGLEMDRILENLKLISEYLDSNPIPSDQELVAQESALRQDLNVVDQEIKKIQNAVNENRNYNNLIINYGQEKSRISQSLEKSQRDLDSYRAPDLSGEHQKLQALSESETSISEKMGQITLLKDQAEKYFFQLETLKEGFKEIKTYVFSSALAELSHRANQFLTVLFHMPSEIKFVNEDLKIQTRILMNEKEMSLGLLSGGQFRRFSLAIDLALSDMVSSRKNSKVNLLILDEYFKDLSEGSMEKCLDLLKSRKCPVLLIEHNSIFKNIVDNVFFVELRGGTSCVARQ